MQMRNALLASVCLTFVLAANVDLSLAQGAAALTGVVTSDQEGPMEGVLVTAKKAGSTIATTVVTNKQGRYSFPASRLEPGEYTIKIRAVGYDLDGKGAAEVAADKPATADLKLKKTRNLVGPAHHRRVAPEHAGHAEAEGRVLNCVSCHTVERIVRSTHDADEFVQIQKRMGTYANQSVPTRPQKRKAERLLEERGDTRNRAQQERAEFLASINLSEGSTWEYPLKTLPRPTGRATEVIITEYDLPRELIEPHDVIVGKDGNVWYTNFGEQNIGRLDPKTGKVTEVDAARAQEGLAAGLAQPALGQGRQCLVRDDVPGRDGQVRPQHPEGRDLQPAARHEQGDDAGQHGAAGVDRGRRQGVVAEQRLRRAPPPRPRDRRDRDDHAVQGRGRVRESHNIYDIIPDSQNNIYFTDFAQQHIGRVDAKTGQTTLFELPTKASAPRRGMMDDKDRIWFGLYRGNKIAMFDTKEQKFKEWEMPTAWSSPYDVTIDKNGDVWTGSMLNDRVSRLDPTTGKFVEYLLPRETNIRRVFVDNSTTPVTFWVGNNHGGSIVKVEPLN